VPKLKDQEGSKMFFLWLHNLLCALIWGGDAPQWLLNLHQWLGWG
jgi:hypothetical protein